MEEAKSSNQDLIEGKVNGIEEHYFPGIRQVFLLRANTFYLWNTSLETKDENAHFTNNSENK